MPTAFIQLPYLQFMQDTEYYDTNKVLHRKWISRPFLIAKLLTRSRRKDAHWFFFGGFCIQLLLNGFSHATTRQVKLICFTGEINLLNWLYCSIGNGNGDSVTSSEMLPRLLLYSRVTFIIIRTIYSLIWAFTLNIWPEFVIEVCCGGDANENKIIL